MTRRRALMLGLAGPWLLAWPARAAAQAISVPALQRLLQQAPRREQRFRETRESPWLETPIESSGTMTASPALLEKKFERPRRETWRILPDRLQLIAGAAPPREVMFGDAPAVAALASALRLMATGELNAMEKDFRLETAGDERRWSLKATPQRAEIARFLKQIELQGSGSQIDVIAILEIQGERTTTRLSAGP